MLLLTKLSKKFYSWTHTNTTASTEIPNRIFSPYIFVATWLQSFSIYGKSKYKKHP